MKSFQRARVGDGMHRDGKLQRAQDQEQDHQLTDAYQDEFSAGESFFDEFPHADEEHQWLHQGFEEPALDGGKDVGNGLDHG